MSLTKADIELNVLNAKRAGLVDIYFSNGSEFDGWLSRCFECRHHLEPPDDIRVPKITPPYAVCAWGVLDRIYHEMAMGRYGYGTSFHPPEDVEMERRIYPTCKRYTHRDDSDPGRDPPKPDVPGQMMLGEAVVIEERVPVTEGSAV